MVQQAVERSDLTAWIARQIHDINDLLDRTFANLKPMIGEPVSELAVATLV
jgi:hypothetical protein